MSKLEERELSVIRTEKKYEITRMQKNTLVNQLGYFLEEDRNGREGYLVRSLYFDGIYDEDYFGKIDGLELRKKLRLRIYSANSEKVKLELKKKEGEAQLKKSLWITKSLAEELIKGRFTGLLELGSQVAEEIYHIMELGVYRPKCIVEYNRVAFWHHVNNIRITFDSDIRVSHDYNDFFAEELTWLPVKDEPVLEVKYNGFLISEVKHMVEKANVSQTSVSKYALSRQVLWV